jgi:cell division protein FtsW
LKELKKYLRGDLTIWLVAFILAIISLVEVYSTTGMMAFQKKEGYTEYYLLQRLGFIGFSFLLMYLIHRVKYSFFSRISVILLLISVPLLLLTLFYGARVNDASRWLYIPGLPFGFQTSDLAKIALVAFVARLLAKNQENMDNPYKVIVPAGAAISVVCALILPANFSTAAMLFMICLMLMFVGRVRIAHIASFLGIILLAGIVLIFILSKMPGNRVKTWQARIENFSGGDDEENYQAKLAKMTIASGSVLGTGPGNNPCRYLLPQSSSDFIFAIINGELGLIGGLGVLMMYLILLYRAVRIAVRAKYSFAVMLSIGIAMLIVVQAFINMSVGVVLMPVTGQPLPFVSMGGTSTLFTGIALGMLLSVSRSLEEHSDEPETNEPEPDEAA